jgi:hypothetical protein
MSTQDKLNLILDTLKRQSSPCSISELFEGIDAEFFSKETHSLVQLIRNLQHLI